MKKNISMFLIWLTLNILTNICTQIALFAQTMPIMENTNYYFKLLTSEFWASMQWMFALPAFRIGTNIMTIPQQFLAGYLINFLIQISSNILWLKKSIPIDDYFTMAIMLYALYISKYNVFN